MYNVKLIRKKVSLAVKHPFADPPETHNLAFSNVLTRNKDFAA